MIDTNLLKNAILERYRSVNFFAKSHNIRQNSIQTIFVRGFENATCSLMFKICKGLNIDLMQLLEGRIVDYNAFTVSKAEEEIIKKMRYLPEDELSELNSIIDLKYRKILKEEQNIDEINKVG